jgi:hypothetical protein
MPVCTGMTTTRVHDDRNSVIPAKAGIQCQMPVYTGMTTETPSFPPRLRHSREGGNLDARLHGHDDHTRA